MSKSQLNLQDSFLNQVRKENIPVTLYLTSGVQLRGQVKGFDAFTVILEGQGKPPQLVYKHSIVSVAPMRHPSSLMQVPPADGVAREEGVPGAPPSEAEGAPAPVGVAVEAATAAPAPASVAGPDE